MTSSILVVGSVAYDTVETPFGRAEKVLGGSASFFAVVEALPNPRCAGLLHFSNGPDIDDVEFGFEFVERGITGHHQNIEQFIDHARIVDEDFREELAPGTELDVEPKQRWINAETFPKHALGAE